MQALFSFLLFLVALLVAIQGSLANVSPVCNLLADTDKQVAEVGYHWKPLGTMQNTTLNSLQDNNGTSIIKAYRFQATKSKDGLNELSILTMIPLSKYQSNPLLKFFIFSGPVVDVKTQKSIETAFRIRYNLHFVVEENKFDGKDIISVDYLISSDTPCLGFPQDNFIVAQDNSFVADQIKDIEVFQLVKNL